MKCEEKISGGKLVCLELWAEGGEVSRAKITGDFFLHPEERIEALEASLRGLRLTAPEAEISSRLQAALGGAVLIGVSPADLARMFRKAVG
jgi:lipoate-protein ligase A